MVEEQLRLPLPAHVPPPDLAVRPSREELNREMLDSLLPRLRAAGFGPFTSNDATI